MMEFAVSTVATAFASNITPVSLGTNRWILVGATRHSTQLNATRGIIRNKTQLGYRRTMGSNAAERFNPKPTATNLPSIEYGSTICIHSPAYAPNPDATSDRKKKNTNDGE